MYPPSEQHRQDWWHVQKFLAGDHAILEDWIRDFEPVLERKLAARGASPTESEDILAHLWSDCVSKSPLSASLLEKYNGRVALQSWLLTVATHRFIDSKRRERLWVSSDSLSPGSRDASLQLREGAATPPPCPLDGALLDLLGSSLREALARCTPDQLLMLRLVYLHGLTQREIGFMWAWHETKVSRALASAMEIIAKETLRSVRQSDPWLQITWEDFLDLCETGQLGFL